VGEDSALSAFSVSIRDQAPWPGGVFCFLVAGLQTWKRECCRKEVHPIRFEHGSPAKQPVVGWILILIKARQLRPFDNFNEQLL
jgi:hypothetical protein